MNRVRALVGSEIVFPSLSPRSTERLRFALSYPHPEYVKSIRMRCKWDGPMRFECITEWPDGSVSVPRGAVDIVRKVLAADELQADFDDSRSIGDSVGSLPVPSARNYQAVGIMRLRDKTQGLIVLPCGGGKTKLGVGAIARIGRTTLILVHTGDLLDQWLREVKDSLGVDAGAFDADRKEIDRPIVVASVFSLVDALEADPSIGARFGMVIADEAHHIPAKTFQRVLRFLPAKYRLGLSATPDREDGHEKLVDWSFGHRLLVKTVQELVAEGFLLMPRLVEVRTDFTFDMDPEDRRRITKLHRAVEMNEERNRQIVELASWEYQAGESVLVLANRTGMCKRLGKMLKTMGVDAHVVIGSTNTTLRRETIEAMRQGDVSLIVATSLADEGLNIERLSRIILAFPEKARGKTIQRVGRLTRLWSGKDPVFYDVVDGEVETLARRASERRRAYRSIGMIV